MHRLRAIVAIAALGLAAGGCAMSFDSTHLGVPVSMASAEQVPAVGTAFHVNRHPVFVLWGMFTAGPPNLEDVLAGQVGPGTGVADLRIKVRATLSDLLFTVLSAGVFSPRTVTFEGVVVQSHD